MENEKSSDKLLAQLRKAAGLTQPHLLLNLTAFIPKNKDKLKEVGAESTLKKDEKYVDFTISAYCKYEKGTCRPPRERALLFIYYFNTKGFLKFEEANELLLELRHSPLDANERKIIFPDEATSGNSSQRASTALVAKQEEAAEIVPAASVTPEAPGETLIVIAGFFVSPNNKDHEIHYEIEGKINKEAQRTGETGLRVEVAPIVLNSRQRAEAEALGQQYNASIVIWGADTGTRITVNFLYLRHPDFEAAVATISETEPNQYTAISAPNPYTTFITDDLPKRLAFLALFAVAHRYYISKDYLRATTLIEEAIASLSNKTKFAGLAEAYYRLGWLYHGQLEDKKDGADYSKVIEIYNQSIELKADFARAYNNRGVAYDQQGMFKEAIADYNKAIELNPDDAKAYNNRGSALYDQGKLIDAITDYNKAIQLDPNLAMAYNNRGNAYSAQGKLDEAIADYSKAIELNPDDAKAYNNRNYAYSEQEMFKGLMLKEGFYIEKPELIKIGVIAFFKSPEVEDIRELAIKTALLNTIPDTIEFTSEYKRVNPDRLSNDIIEPAKYAHRKSEIGDNLLSINEVQLARRRDGFCVFLAIGTNPNGEECFAYCSIRVEKINHLVRMIQEGRITPAIVGRVKHYRLGTPGQKDMDDMFDQWLFTARKTTVKYIAHKAG